MDRDEKVLEALKEKLKLYLEALRNLVILLIATTGGTIGLLFKFSHPVAISRISFNDRNSVWNRQDTAFIG